MERNTDSAARALCPVPPRYRKNFTHTPSHLVPNERVSIRFDGVYMNSDMYLNDVFLGNHPYGYTAFQYDLTPHLKTGNNVLAVRIRDLGRNSRWYSGSGMFRHTHLITTPDVHIGLWGVVTRTEVSDDKSSATVSVSVLCENNGTAAAPKPGLTATIMDASGKTVATGTADVPALAAGGSAEVNITGLQVKSPTLWDTESTYLYSVKVDLSPEKGAPPGATQDTEVVQFGIRTISFTADDGFQLNGKKINLQGGCVHHDNGPLGSATIGRAEERRVENLKNLGYNAIRTSHNPVSPAFLDACDKLGVLVMHEAFDCFEGGKVRKCCQPCTMHRVPCAAAAAAAGACPLECVLLTPDGWMYALRTQTTTTSTSKTGGSAICRRWSGAASTTRRL